MNEISAAATMFWARGQAMQWNKWMMFDETVSGNSSMAASKLEILLSQLVDKVGMKSPRLQPTPTFWGSESILLYFGRHLGFPTFDSVEKYSNHSHWIAGLRKHGFSCWDFVPTLSTSSNKCVSLLVLTARWESIPDWSVGYNFPKIFPTVYHVPY